jgi:hypothetical protein
LIPDLQPINTSCCFKTTNTSKKIFNGKPTSGHVRGLLFNTHLLKLQQSVVNRIQNDFFLLVDVKRNGFVIAKKLNYSDDSLIYWNQKRNVCENTSDTLPNKESIADEIKEEVQLYLGELIRESRVSTDATSS